MTLNTFKNNCYYTYLRSKDHNILKFKMLTISNSILRRYQLIIIKYESLFFLINYVNQTFNKILMYLNRKTKL